MAKKSQTSYLIDLLSDTSKHEQVRRFVEEFPAIWKEKQNRDRISQNVRILQVCVGIETITELARKSGYDGSHISRVLAGLVNADPIVFIRLAEVLRVSVATLALADLKTELENVVKRLEVAK